MGINSATVYQSAGVQPTLTVQLPKGAKLFPVGMFLVAKVIGYAADGRVEIQTDHGQLLANTPFVFKKGDLLQLVVRESTPKRLVLQLLVPQDLDDPQLEVLINATGLAPNKDLEEIALGLLNRRILINKSILLEAGQLLQDLPSDIRERALDVYTLLLRAGIKLESQDLVAIIRTAILEPTLSSAIGPLIKLLKADTMRAPLLEAVLKEAMVKLGPDFSSVGAGSIHNALSTLYTTTPFELASFIIDWLVKRVRERQSEFREKLNAIQSEIQQKEQSDAEILESNNTKIPVPPSQEDDIVVALPPRELKPTTQHAEVVTTSNIKESSTSFEPNEPVEITLRNLEVLLRTLMETPQMQSDPKLLYHVQLLLDQLVARQLLMALQPEVRRFSLPIELAEEQFDAEIEVRDLGKEGYKDSKLIRIYIPSDNLGVIETLINLQGPVLSIDILFERDETLELFKTTEQNFEQRLKEASVYIIRRLNTARIPDHAVNIFGEE